MKFLLGEPVAAPFSGPGERGSGPSVLRFYYDFGMDLLTRVA